MIWQLYKYIYYWLYTWQKTLWGENDIPEYNAAIGMSLSLLANCGTTVIFFYLITDTMIIPLDVPKKIVIIPIFLVMLLHYFLFIHRGKYIEIEKEFKNESRKERKRKGFWVLIYTFGSILLYIFMMLYGIWIKN